MEYASDDGVSYKSGSGRSEERMEKDCDDALRQIVKRKYAEALVGYRQIACYGISFFRKSALVKKL